MHNYSVIWGYAGRIIVRYVNFYRVLALRGICKIFVRRILCFANVKLCDILKMFVPKRTSEEIFVGPDYRPFILTEGIFDFMIDQYFLVLTTIDLFVLTFMCILTKLSETLNSKQKRGFFLAFVLIGVISILEVITILVDGEPAHLRWLNILSNYLGFGLSPAVSLCLVYVLDKKQGVRRGFKTAVACEAAYLISLALMLPGGMVFSVSEENLYSRGDFFAFYVTAYFAALVYLAACTAITARVLQNRSRVLIYPLIVFLAAETIIQIALPQLHVTGCASRCFRCCISSIAARCGTSSTRSRAF